MLHSRATQSQSDWKRAQAPLLLCRGGACALFQSIHFNSNFRFYETRSFPDSSECHRRRDWVADYDGDLRDSCPPWVSPSFRLIFYEFRCVRNVYQWAIDSNHWGRVGHIERDFMARRTHIMGAFAKHNLLGGSGYILRMDVERRTWRIWHLSSSRILG